MQPYAPLIRRNAPSGVPGTNFMGGIHPRLKRPVGRRLAVAAAALLHPKGGHAAIPLSGPTLSGCRFEATGPPSSSGATMTLQFNATLLGDDEVQC